jgi:probable addiction module antidote protein
MATKSYAQWRQQKLTDPARALRYLQAARRESNEAFLYAVKNVIQANNVTKVAKEVGVTRESVYRSFAEDGNPAFFTVASALEAVGLEVDFRVSSKGAEASSPESAPIVYEPVSSANVPNVSAENPAVGIAANIRALTLYRGSSVSNMAISPVVGWNMIQQPGLLNGINIEKRNDETWPQNMTLQPTSPQAPLTSEEQMISLQGMPTMSSLSQLCGTLN